jgi:hypothetical protein
MGKKQLRQGDPDHLKISTKHFLKQVKKASGTDLEGFADIWMYVHGLRLHSLSKASFLSSKYRTRLSARVLLGALWLPL